MDIFFPTLMMTYLAPFRQVFSRPTWPYFQGFVWALLILQGRKTVTRIAEACFFIDRHLASWERFLAQYQWDLGRVFLTLLSLLQQQLDKSLHIHKAYLLALDTFLVAKASRKMLGVQPWKDSSGNPDRGGHLRGHHWALGALLSRHQGRWLAWPVLTRLLSGQLNPACFVAGREGIRPATVWDGTVALVRQFHHTLGGPPLRVVVDAFFSKAPFLQPLMENGIEVITRLRKDGVGWDDPLPYPGRGRPRKMGKKWVLAELVREFLLTWITVELYGKRTEVGVVVRDLWLRNLARKVRVVAVVGRRGGEPVLLLSTDMTLDAAQIIELYGARFAIEIAIRDLKGLGIGDYQCTTSVAIERFAQLCCVAFCLGRLLMLEKWGSEERGRMEVSLSVREGRFSFSRLRRWLRGVALQGVLFAKFGWEAEMGKVKEVTDPLLRMLA
jgi:hypothetical protein